MKIQTILERLDNALASGDEKELAYCRLNLLDWDNAGNSRWDLPSEFKSYVETMLWSSINPDDETPLDRNHDIDSLTPEFLVSSLMELRQFLSENSSLIDGNWVGSSPDGSSELDMAAHDFWLTRNHHGTGFWDGNWETGEELTTASQKFGEVNLFVNDEGLVESL